MILDKLRAEVAGEARDICSAGEGERERPRRFQCGRGMEEVESARGPDAFFIVELMPSSGAAAKSRK